MVTVRNVLKMEAQFCIIGTYCCYWLYAIGLDCDFYFFVFGKVDTRMYMVFFPEKFLLQLLIFGSNVIIISILPLITTARGRPWAIWIKVLCLFRAPLSYTFGLIIAHNYIEIRFVNS